MGRIILHIGTHKTGTTSLQKGLSRNREQLEARGIYYPDYDLIGAKSHYAHIGIVNAFSKAHPDLSREQAETFFAEVHRRSADYDLTILSAEPFFRHVGFGANGQPRKVPRNGEAYWVARNDYIRDVRDQFVGADVEIVMAVRRQVDYGMSLYQEHVKTSRYSGDFSTFRETFWPRFDYLRQARAWREAFGAFRLLRFEDLVRQKDVLAAFGRAIDANLDDLLPAPFTNAALPPDLVVWKRMMHMAQTSERTLRKQVDTLLSGPLAPLFAALPKRSLYTSFEDMRAFHRQFEDANELLKREFMPPDLQGTPMFSNDLREDYLFGDALHPEFLIHLAAHLSKL
tara:strand:+ start:273890 stop:274915 length:1026 start_codon:yes stop_codon:yes gene_type:complete